MLADGGGGSSTCTYALLRQGEGAGLWLLESTGISQLASPLGDELVLALPRQADLLVF